MSNIKDNEEKLSGRRLKYNVTIEFDNEVELDATINMIKKRNTNKIGTGWLQDFLDRILEK